MPLWHSCTKSPQLTQSKVAQCRDNVALLLLQCKGFLAADEQSSSKWPVAILAGLVLLAIALVAAVVAANPGIFQSEFKAQFLLVIALKFTSGACCTFMH